MTLNQYLMAANAAYLDNPWRIGQAYFNVLDEVRPDLANSIRGTVHDPFYRDAILPHFLAIIAGEW